MQVKIKKLHPDAIVPKYATTGAACFDLNANLPCGTIDLFTDEAVNIGTGLAFEIPQDHVMLVFSRSGHGFKNGVRLSNCVGVIDSDYRGEVIVSLRNDHQEKLLRINPGDRIAQAMILPVQQVSFLVVDELGDTERGAGGFGSTGQ